MSRRDIMPYYMDGKFAPLVQHYNLNASESFLLGEPVSVNADGELTESADRPVDADFLGIAASDGDTTNAGGLATARNPGGAQFTDGQVVTTGDLIPVWVCDTNTLLVTSNFSSGGAAFGDVAPARSNIGDQATLDLISGSWGISLAVGGGADIVRIHDVLSADGRSLRRDNSLTGAKVVFSVVASQNNTLGTADAPVA